jgi:enoyl-CoA hydratase
MSPSPSTISTEGGNTMAKKKVGVPPYRDEERIRTDDFEEIIYEKDPPVGRIILNGPEKRNPLGYARKMELAMGLQEMELDDDIHVIIIKGAGPSFCAGYDITPIKPGEPQRNGPASGVYQQRDKDSAWNAGYQSNAREVYFRIFDLQKPVIAQIHGYCLAGGTHLAGFCDLRVVADDAQIGFPVIRNWTTQGFQYEIWLMGPTRAKYYLFTGDPMDGKQAYERGWASAVFPAAKLEEETEKLARKIALTDPVLQMLTKRSLNRQMELMGFKTGMQWSMDIRAGARNRPGEGEGDQFRKIALEKGLKAALDWRDKTFGIAYRTSEKAQKLKQR